MKNLRKNTVFFLLVLNLFISGCTIQIGESDPIEIALDQSRPSVATQVPEVSGTITDVRITAVERQFKDTIDEEYPNCTYLQIYYGYQSDGVWYDYPSENYELKGTFSRWSKLGFEVAGEEHVVQIGPFLIFSVREKFSLPGTEPQLFDSLGSKVLTPFEEYYTPKDLPKDAVRYGYMKEDPDSVISGEFTRYQIYKEMGHFYYLIVNVNDMTEDYTVHKLHETSSGTEEKILTMEDIRMLLSYTGED